MNSAEKPALLKRLHLHFIRRLPQLIQAEASECGLVCLAMVAGYYRHYVDMHELRRQIGLSSQGADLQSLIKIARTLKLRSRPLRLELNELVKLRTPCVLHWDLCHFVVLLKVGRNHIVIQDPAFGRRKISLALASHHFTGIALELWPDSDFTINKADKKFGLRRVVSNIGGFRSFLTRVLALSLLIESINLLLPVGTQLVMDHVILAKDGSLLSLICLGLLAFIFSRTLISMWRAWLTLSTSVSIDIQWCEKFIDHLIRLPYGWFEKRKLGDIQSRFSSLDAIRTVLTNSVTSIIIDSIMVIGVLVMMSLYGGWLVWVVVGFMLIYVLMRLFTYPLYRQITEEQIINNARASSHFMETVHGIATIKALNLSGLRGMQWLTLKVDAINSEIRISRFDMVFNGISTLISTLDQVAVLWLGASMVMDDTFSLGMFVAFNAWRGEFSARTVNLINTLLQLRMLNLHCDRVADIALSDAEAVSTGHADLFEHRPVLSLSARSIDFRYDKFSPALFHKLDIHITGGECVALIGASGAGKTTLLKILAGLLTPDAGEICVDGVNIQQWGIENYRGRIACVLQDDKLFSGTIEENIAGFEHEIDRQRVIDCAQRCCIHDEIMKMPMVYQTLIGELGGNISGGQRQRLLIARALYRQPSLLFMDEATSHLDLENEARINAAISSLRITRVIVAHRPSTIASADRVIPVGAVPAVAGDNV